MYFSALLKIAVFFLCICFGVAPSYAQPTSSLDSAPAENTASIGVLAYRGDENAVKEWQSLAAYLSDSIEGWAFELVPVTLSSVQNEINEERIEFLITNPGHYVTLAAKHNLSALATRERWAKTAGAHFSEFGTAIFVATDSSVASLNDIKGTRVAAVSPEAFGGFQIAWSEMQKQGVDAFRDLGSLRFLGFPHDHIIAAVAEGNVDVGIVRGGLLEILADEGKINLDDFRVLNLQENNGGPYRVSSSLFSEWPFAALPSVDKKLRENVLITLLKSQEQAVVAKYGLQDLWSAPLSYENTRKLVGAFQRRIAAIEPRTTFGWNSIATLAVLAALLGLTMLSVFMYRRQSGLPQGSAGDRPARKVPAEFQKYEENLKSLTQREKEVLELICSGHKTKSIADALGISPKTVEFHRTNLLQKTEARTTAHLVQIATRLGYDQGVSLG